MFVQRYLVEGRLPDPGWVQIAPAYVGLAGFACALLVIPVLALGGAAARLGARGRARRLASLRLVGMTGGEVVRMSVLETLIQSMAGLVVGSVVYVVSLPLWQLLTFQAQPVRAFEMLLPWWLWLGVVGILLVLSMLSTALGLRRVTISPLGVARNQSAPGLKRWRLVTVVLLVVLFAIYLRNVNLANMIGLLSTIALLVIVIGSIMVVGPWLLQLVARPATRTGSVPKLIAARRILADPRAAWRNVASLSLLGFIAGFVGVMPMSASDSDPMGAAFVGDIQTGVAITLAVGLVLAATATLMTQASQVFDMATETVTLDRIGVPPEVHVSVRRRMVITPLAVALGTSIPLGLGLSMLMGVESEAFPWIGVVILAVTVVAGFLLSLAAVEACRPLQAGVLGEQRRRND